MQIEDRDRHLTETFAHLGRAVVIDAESPLATMDWDEIEKLSKTGLIHFGSHTHTHPILSRCDEARQRQELCTSRDIREHLGSANLFAYPNGTRADFRDVTKRCLVELGYHCGLSTLPGLNSATADFYELRRVGVGANMTLHAFEAAMTGL